jgi:hypothetical protein
MTRLPGHIIFDTYDDEDGQVLRTIFEDQKHLPPFVKTASRLTESQIDNLPDDMFALVLIAGSQKFKKYATVDRGNTALSVLYLLKQAETLPPEIVSTAANNLMAALDMYGMPIPDELIKAANKKNTVSIGSSVPGKSQKPFNSGSKVQSLQYPEILEEPKESHDNPQLGRHDAAWDDVNLRTNVEGTPGSNFLELPTFPQKEKYKVAGQVFVGSGQDKTPEASVQRLLANPSSTKQQIWRDSPYFEISGWDPSQPVQPYEAEQALLDGRYPVDSYEQVKTASVYFGDNWKDMTFRDRHTYCVKLASRMSELGIPIPDDISRYGSTTYAADVDSYVETRRSYVQEESHPALDMLLEKRAKVSPGVFAEALAEFDRFNDLNLHWDGNIPDPWYSTFGPSLEKISEENWRWDGVGTRVSEDDLKDLARNSYDRLVNSFGTDFAKEFAKNPKSFFLSLPDPNKLILARFASDRHSGTLE